MGSNWRKSAAILMEAWLGENDFAEAIALEHRDRLVASIAEAMEQAFKTGVSQGIELGQKSPITYPGYTTCKGCNLDFIEYRDWLMHDCPEQEAP